MRRLALAATLLLLVGAAVAVLPFAAGTRDQPAAAQLADEGTEDVTAGSDSEQLRVQVGRIVAAMTKAAQVKEAGLEGDQLAEHYVRSAAAAALQESGGEPARAFVVALGFGLDHTNTLARQPVVRLLLGEVESREGRARRRNAMGKPTTRGRNDLLLHFAISSALTGLAGAPTAEAFGVQKEVGDARGKQRGRGSGFSFADLAADYTGIELAEVLLEGRSRKRAMLRWIAEEFRSEDFFVDPGSLEEGLPYSTWVEQYGGVEDARHQQAVEALRRQIRACPGWAELRAAGKRTDKVSGSFSRRPLLTPKSAPNSPNR